MHQLLFIHFFFSSCASISLLLNTTEIHVPVRDGAYIFLYLFGQKKFFSLEGLWKAIYNKLRAGGQKQNQKFSEKFNFYLGFILSTAAFSDSYHYSKDIYFLMVLKYLAIP